MAGANRQRRTRDESNESHDELWKTDANVTNCELSRPAYGARAPQNTAKYRKIKAFLPIRNVGGANTVELNAIFPFWRHFSTG
jgi:hypothetical protein